MEPRAELVTLTEPESAAAEAYRALRTSLIYAGLDEPLRSVVLAPPAPDRGRTEEVAANLGVVLAQSGQEVILVDADLRHPTLHRLFGLENGEGVSEAVLLPAEAPLPLRETGVTGLSLLTAGKPPLNAADLLASKRMEKLVQRLEQQADFVLFAAPPITAVTDAAVLGRLCDGLVLTVRAGRTRRDRLAEAKQVLERWEVRTLGAVLLDSTTRHLWQGY